MSAYSSSYAMFVLLYPLYYLYLTNCNTLVRNNNLVSFFANRAFVVAGPKKKKTKKKVFVLVSQTSPTPNNETYLLRASVRKAIRKITRNMQYPYCTSFLSIEASFPDRKTVSVSRSLSTEYTQIESRGRTST